MCPKSQAWCDPGPSLSTGLCSPFSQQPRDSERAGIETQRPLSQVGVATDPELDWVDAGWSVNQTWILLILGHHRDGRRIITKIIKILQWYYYYCSLSTWEMLGKRWADQISMLMGPSRSWHIICPRLPTCNIFNFRFDALLRSLTFCQNNIRYII